MAKDAEKSKKRAVAGTKTTWKQALKRDWQLYLLLLVPVALVVIFNYAAYPGLRMAFMDYKPAKGYEGSDWVGFKTFAKIFQDADFGRALKNSLVFNLLDLLVGFLYILYILKEIQGIIDTNNHYKSEPFARLNSLS